MAVWQFSGTKGQEEQATLLQRYYGHDARVWKALLVRDYVISVGEVSNKERGIVEWTVDCGLDIYMSSRLDMFIKPRFEAKH